MRVAFLFTAALAVLSSGFGQDENSKTHVFVGDTPLYTEFFDSEAAFYEATLDLRDEALPYSHQDVVPRSILIPLEDNCFVAFDTELLRVAAIWQGDFPTKTNLSTLSYELPLTKAKGGFKELPKPQGRRFAGTGVYPGWQPTTEISRTDPRTLFTDPQEFGKGPAAFGQWRGVIDYGRQARLSYTLGTGKIEEWFAARKEADQVVVSRWIQFENLPEDLSLIAHDRGSLDSSDSAGLDLQALPSTKKKRILRIDYVSSGEVRFAFEGPAFAPPQKELPIDRWPTEVTSPISLGSAQGAYAVDEIELPYPNPWQRRIRPSNIAFLPSGDAIVLTFDGDVYRISNLDAPEGPAMWARIARGFNEPQGLALRDSEIFVFSRGGITRLVDENGDGETDLYDMFCNRFVQSPGSRDFAASLLSLHDGSFLIAKGGQQVSAQNPHSGRVLQISPNGREARVFAHGLRNAILGYDPVSRIVTASDQQGHYVPSTPFYLIEEDKYYGFAPARPNGETSIQDPQLWLPHRQAQSGIGQVMGFDERAGSLQGQALYLNYQRPSALRIAIPSPGQPQTSGMVLPVLFETPLLYGAINPQDGFPYMVGFQIWDCIARRLEGICRLRVLTDHDGRADRAQPYENGMLLSFPSPLETARATNPDNYRLNAWNYRRTPDYGSPQYTLDESPGTNSLKIEAAFLSQDRRSVFLLVPKMPLAQQIEARVDFGDDPYPLYTTSNRLEEADLAAFGFSNFDLSIRRQPDADENAPQIAASADRGRTLYTDFGCMGCHSIDGSTAGKNGPSWLHLFGSQRALIGGASISVDKAYLRESIFNPAAEKAVGYDGADAGMPSYLGILSEQDVESLILYIETLK